MRIKIFPIFLCIIFFIIFLVFYKGLQNSNIYIPENNIKQNIPTFSTKIFNKDKTSILGSNIQKSQQENTDKYQDFSKIELRDAIFEFSPIRVKNIFI